MTAFVFYRFQRDGKGNVEMRSSAGRIPCEGYGQRAGDGDVKTIYAARLYE